MEVKVPNHFPRGSVLLLCWLHLLVYIAGAMAPWLRKRTVVHMALVRIPTETTRLRHRQRKPFGPTWTICKVAKNIVMVSLCFGEKLVAYIFLSYDNSFWFKNQKIYIWCFINNIIWQSTLIFWLFNFMIDRTNFDENYVKLY